MATIKGFSIKVNGEVVEFEPVRHGEWIDTSGTEVYTLAAKCPLCDGESPRELFFAIKTPYCPHCGAKMDLE